MSEEMNSSGGARPVEDLPAWLLAYQDLMHREADRNAGSTSFDSAEPEGNECECVVLIRRQDFVLEAAKFQVTADPAGDWLRHTGRSISQLHKEQAKAGDVRDPYIWALLRWSAPLQFTYLKSVVLDTMGSGPFWAAYIDQVTSSARYGSISEDGLVDLLRMVKAWEPGTSFLQQYLAAQHRTAAGSLEDFLFLRSGDAPARH